MSNPYLQVFFEAAHAASIFPLASEAAFYAMSGFGGYHMGLAGTMAVAGGTAGHLFNWWLGRMIRRLPPPADAEKSERMYARAQALFHKYLVWLLLFAWAPLCNILVLAAGFLGVRLKVALPLILAGLAAYYGMGLM